MQNTYGFTLKRPWLPDSYIVNDHLSREMGVPFRERNPAANRKSSHGLHLAS